MSVINLWLSDYVDYSIVEDNDCNVLVSEQAVAKFDTEKNTNTVSPLHWMSDINLVKYSKNKRAWSVEGRCATKSFFQKSLNTYGLSNEYACAIERVFLYRRLSCLDALIFAKSCSRGNINRKIRIIVGKSSGIAELTSIIFWLAACESFFHSNNIDFYLVSRGGNFEMFPCALELLAKLSFFLTIEPKVKGNVENYKGDKCIMWMGSLRFPLGWDEMIRLKNDGNFDILRIIQPEQRYAIPGHYLILSPGGGDSLVTLRELYAYSMKSICDSKLLSGIDIVENYYKNGVSYFAASHISKIVDCLDSKLHNVNIVNFYSVAAPHLESIALHMSIAKKGVLPTLLPHSYIQSYEFSPKTYKESWAFIKSNFILNPLFHDLRGVSKEGLVPIDEVEVCNSKEFLKTSLTRKFLVKFRLISKYKLNKWLNLIRYNFIEYGKNKQNVDFYNESIKKSKLCIGLVLNVEVNESSVIIPFNKLFKTVLEIEAKLHKHLGRQSVLSIRPKPGWTNVSLLKKSFKNERSPLVCPQTVSLLEYGEKCQLVLFMQGTSAIAELMKNKNPCVCIDSSDFLIKLDIDNISYPVEIVPKMTIEEVLKKLHNDLEWVAKLNVIQSEWVRSQMLVTKE